MDKFVSVQFDNTKSVGGHRENVNLAREQTDIPAPTHVPAESKTSIRAIDCLRKMRALLEVLKIKNMELVKSERCPTLPLAAAASPPLAAETQTSPPEASYKFSPPARMMEPSRSKVKKWLSGESPKQIPEQIQRRRPRRTLLTEVALVVKSPSSSQPAPAQRLLPKAQEFVSSSKASELYAKYSQIKLHIDAGTGAGRTTGNTVSDFIEVKINRKTN